MSRKLDALFAERDNIRKMQRCLARGTIYDVDVDWEITCKQWADSLSAALRAAGCSEEEVEDG